MATNYHAADRHHACYTLSIHCYGVPAVRFLVLATKKRTKERTKERTKKKEKKKEKRKKRKTEHPKSQSEDSKTLGAFSLILLWLMMSLCSTCPTQTLEGG
ncbi:uncharacterized protein BO95DRAFT_442913 [Aspergillus brunneoviolaceus CBS 621.78]|uniref:Uncharacterized protein n=1 Tax=Aspergillus brunneoviolaceus CBS 621.78 TaxID=1450534 RepID=A0ACD1G8G5_9EURO|nr:hypothetical protein BO95DRAFT_442913 [Aspergillus brunneoviolaceus CBS 621.78]RAH45534.1 hypothetical protein BO95DRAFT_442913 [Aspergillus brunneoviolaceus CBS 621.78]